jgi:hypothetical protein
LRRFIGTLLVGLVAGGALASDVSFGLRARTGDALIAESGVYGAVVYTPGRSRRTIADVIHWVDGRPVNATLRAWYCHLRPGEHVHVLYLSASPGEVSLDRFWQRHFASAATMAVRAVVASVEVSAFVARRRRNRKPSFLRDD